MKGSDRLRILFLGPRWYGSCARACCSALRRLDHDVVDLSPDDFRLSLSGVVGRVAMRIAEPFSWREYNRVILKTARTFRPDFLLAFKGIGILPETVRSLRQAAIATYNYYPDPIAWIKNRQMLETLPEYDCVFDTKKTLGGTLSVDVPLRDRVFLAHGYDPECHRPLPLSDRDREQFGCDVGYVGSYMPRKQDILLPLVNMRPQLNLRIWGNGWHAADPALRRYVAGSSITGSTYARALCAARIGLGIMGFTRQAIDMTSTRTFEIPACGAFMLHERTKEVLELYEEGKEIECFSSPDELAQKIDHYLQHDNQREAIARRGHQRCVPAYSYEMRVQQIIAYHLTHSGREANAAGA